MEKLKNKTLTGLIWNGINSYGGFAIRLGFSIAVARFVDPEDYGLIGMLAIFLAFSTMLFQSGFQESLVQKHNPTETDYSTVFVFNMVVSIVLYFLLWISAPWIADFYNEPRLILITKVVAIILPIGAAGSVQFTHVVKNLDFKTEAKIQFSSVVISGTIGVIMAYYGYGVWALVVHNITGPFFYTLFYWLFVKWNPKIMFSMSSLRSLYSYGWKVFMLRLINTIFDNIYYPIIGKYYPVAELGFFTRAKRFQNIIVQKTSTTFTGVLFPVFSSLQNNPEKLRQATAKSFRLMAFLTFPIITIFIVTTPPFIQFFLTDKWMPVVPYMQLLYILGYIQPIVGLNIAVTNALGRSDIALKLNFVFKALVVVSILVGFQFGVIGLIIGRVMVSFVEYTVTAIVCGKKINFGLTEQLGYVFPVALVSGLMYLMCYAFSLIPNIHALPLLMMQTVLGLGFYFQTMKMFKSQSHADFKKLLTERVPKKYSFLLKIF